MAPSAGAYAPGAAPANAYYGSAPRQAPQQGYNAAPQGYNAPRAAPQGYGAAPQGYAPAAQAAPQGYEPAPDDLNGESVPF